MLIYHLKETRWRHAALNTQQVVLRRADSRYEEIFLIKALMLPWVRTLQTDTRDSDENRTEVSGVQGESTGGKKNSHGIEENTTNEKNNKSRKEEQKPGTEIDTAGNLSNSTQT